jgi:hypothetical protein
MGNQVGSKKPFKLGRQEKRGVVRNLDLPRLQILTQVWDSTHLTGSRLSKDVLGVMKLQNTLTWRVSRKLQAASEAVPELVWQHSYGMVPPMMQICMQPLKNIFVRPGLVVHTCNSNY